MKNNPKAKNEKQIMQELTQIQKAMINFQKKLAAKFGEYPQGGIIGIREQEEGGEYIVYFRNSTTGNPCLNDENTT